MIPYPSNPQPYVSTPWVDPDTQIAWLWASRGPDINGVPQGKWGRAPNTGTLVVAYTSSATPPADRTIPWYDTTDGSWNTFDTGADAWVVSVGMTGPRGRDYARETQWLTPVENQVITVAEGKDSTIYLNGATSLSRVDIMFPVGFDGQMVLLVPPPYGSMTINARLYWVSAGYSTSQFSAGGSYAYQYVASLQMWKTL